MNPKTNRKLLHVVDHAAPTPRSKRWKSDAERLRLPVVNQHGSTPAPPLPEHGHEALERLLGKGK